MHANESCHPNKQEVSLPMTTEPRIRSYANSSHAQRRSHSNDVVAEEESLIVPRNPRWLWLKLTVEIVLATVLLLVTLPVIALAGLIVKLTSRGPALYWQTRVGLRGREFRLCKIRTMVANAEAFSG